jgi:cytochrome c oxidase subunit 2
LSERTTFAVAVLALVLIGIGLLVANQVDLLPALAATRAAEVDRLFRMLIGIATVIFLIVEGGLIYAVIRFRRQPGDESEGAAYHGNNALELIWTLIPAIIVVVVGFSSYRALARIERPQGDPLVVEVVARQFTWVFRYPQAGLTASELHLPLGRPVRLEITSEDVIHSLWVPNFLAKRDATPGRVSELVVTPSQAGIFPIRCAELCGAGHAIMISQVVVQPPDEFEAWIAAETAAHE